MFRKRLNAITVMTMLESPWKSKTCRGGACWETWLYSLSCSHWLIWLKVTKQPKTHKKTSSYKAVPIITVCSLLSTNRLHYTLFCQTYFVSDVHGFQYCFVAMLYAFISHLSHVTLCFTHLSNGKHPWKLMFFWASHHTEIILTFSCCVAGTFVR